MTQTPIAIGDIQGCHSAFQSLIKKLSMPADTPLWVAGDVINRGPATLPAQRPHVELGPPATVVHGKNPRKRQ
jgi:bis(5'-nucleosyl)-tetraphosphatase (symmetrical)